MVDVPFELNGKRIWVAGHRGMVGSAIVRRLARGQCEVLTVDRRELDLTRQSDVEAWLRQVRPDAVVLAAARVGGIHANATLPADFITTNILIGTNVIDASHKVGVAKLLNLGSGCMYPREAPQPVAEKELLRGPPEPTNEAYAIAKIAAVKLASSYRAQHGREFITAIPTNLYGPGDNLDPQMSHVIPALMRRMDDARRSGAPEVHIWGSGKPTREFMFVDDAADALVFVMEHYSGEEPINVGTGQDVSIRQLAEAIAETVGCRSALVFDTSKPDGSPRRMLDNSRLAKLGWRGGRPLAQGLSEMYRWYLGQRAKESG